MVELFPLPIFPQGALTSSVITTAWVGIFVVCFFNLRLGWVLSGMIVPGYLVPLLLIKPWSAGVIILEGIVTYLIVWFFSEKLSRLGFWSSLFGRDRFFTLVVVSVFVRLLFDVWLLPSAGKWITETLSFNFDYRNNLHSFGLIIVSLVANQFWKTGLIKGLWPLFVTLATSYIIVRYGLMELTNFTLSNLNYIYEDIASSILASPKAYIILLAAAYIASRMNLRYGWDYNGILIPALLALQWYQPSKILTSFIEAFVILWIARSLLLLPAFANINIEGARKILLFFNIGFVYKLILGYVLLWQFPDVKVTDFYGFGYLLSTLMAIKMHDKGIAVRFTKSTVQTSLIAVFVASIIGFGLTIASAYISEREASVQNTEINTIKHVNKTLKEQIRDDKLILYQSRLLKRQNNPVTYEIDLFTNGLRKIKNYLKKRDESLLNQAFDYFHQMGYQLMWLEERYLYLREKNQVRGWGIYVIDTKTSSRLVVEVPYPLDENGVLQAGVSFYTKMEGMAFAAGGVQKKLNIDNSSDVLANRQSLFHLFHEIMVRSNVVQVRLQNLGDNILLVKKNIPEDLDLNKLKQLIPDISFEWGQTHETNRQRESTQTGFSELYLKPESIRLLIVRKFFQEKKIKVEYQYQRIDGYLQNWILNSRDKIAPSGSNLYKIPKQEEMLFFDEEVITPLLSVIEDYKKKKKWTENIKLKLQRITGNAHVLNYRLVRYQHISSGQEYFILYEEGNKDQKHYWGTFVFRLKQSEDYIIEIPRPIYEINSFEYAASLFEQLNARALLIAGAHPYANLDGTADMVQVSNKNSILTLVNQVIMREKFNERLFVFSIRAFGFREDVNLPDSDILISLSHGINSDTNMPGELNVLLGQFKRNHLSYQFVQGEPETSGYEIGSIPQSLYALVSQNKVFGVIWLSPFIRKNYQQKQDDRLEIAHFNGVNIVSKEMDVVEFLVQQLTHPILIEAKDLADIQKIRSEMMLYFKSRDFLNLYKISRINKKFSYLRVIDKNTHQSFMVIYYQKNKTAKKQIILTVNLSPTDIKKELTIQFNTNVKKLINKYINQRIAWLVTEEVK